MYCINTQVLYPPNLSSQLLLQAQEPGHQLEFRCIHLTFRTLMFLASNFTLMMQTQMLYLRI